MKEQIIEEITETYIEKDKYTDWLENMLTMLSKNYMELVKASSADVLQSVNLPRQDETRKAIRLISENARPTHDDIGEQSMEHFTHVLIEKQRRKNNAN